RCSVDASGFGGRHDLGGPCLEGVVVAVVAVAVTAQVEGDHAATVRELRTDVIPPARMGHTAVHQHDSGAVSFAPCAVVDACTVDVHAAGFARDREGVDEPLRSSAVIAHHSNLCEV